MKKNNNKYVERDSTKQSKYTKGKAFRKRSDSEPKKDTNGTHRNKYLMESFNGTNDFAWYNKLGTLTSNAASFYLTNPAGKPIGNLNSTNGSLNPVPGIMVIDMLPAFAPTSTNANQASVSGLNIAAKQLYAKMRKANAGARSMYEAPDLLIYTLAVESIYSFLSSCARAYGFLSNYPTNNRYFVEPLIKAMGFDYEDLIANRLQFLNFINTSIHRLSRYVIPQGFTSFERSLWVNSNVFGDTATTIKCQLYVPRMLAYWKFNSTSMDTGGCLELKYDSSSSPRTVASCIAFFEDLLAPIAQDDDFLTISGDILKFTDNVVKFGEIDINYQLSPLYDENVLLQLHNLDFIALDNSYSTTAWEVGDLGSYPTDLPYNSTYTVFQKDGLLYFQPIMKVTSTSISDQFKCYKEIHGTEGQMLYIDTPEDVPSTERIVESTRLLTTYDTKQATTECIAIDSCGHEIVVGVRLLNNTNLGNVSVTPYHSIKTPGASSANFLEFAEEIIKMSPFGWDIKVCLRYEDSLDISIVNIHTHWNTRSIGVFDKNGFIRLNDIIQMSLLTL